MLVENGYPKHRPSPSHQAKHVVIHRLFKPEIFCSIPQSNEASTETKDLVVVEAPKWALAQTIGGLKLSDTISSTKPSKHQEHCFSSSLKNEPNRLK
jgi:hypothetical protein